MTRVRILDQEPGVIDTGVHLHTRSAMGTDGPVLVWVLLGGDDIPTPYRSEQVVSTGVPGDGVASHGWLCDRDTAERLRPASGAEYDASVAAAEKDGGAGSILAADHGEQRVYVED